MLSGVSLDNEKSYLIAEFARLALGTDNLDYNGRLCMVSAGAANKRALGIDIPKAEVVCVIGADIAECAPITTSWIWRARDNGAKLIVADPRVTPTARTADLFLGLKPGTDSALLGAMLPCSSSGTGSITTSSATPPPALSSQVWPVHHRLVPFGLQVAPAVDGALGQQEPAAGDDAWGDADPVLLRSVGPWPKVDIGRAGLDGHALDQDTPAGPVKRVDEVDLEAHRHAAQQVELRARVGPEHDVVSVDGVVDRHDERRPAR